MIQYQSNIQRDQQQQRLALSAENAKRFDGAVKQLQKNSDISALGAIYSLGELTKQDGFYWPSVTQLTAYLGHVAREKNSSAIETDKDRSNRTEIQHLLHVLSERDKDHWKYRFSEPFPLDLASLSLRDLRFSGLKLWGSNFRRTDFSGSILPGANLAYSDLYCANFESAIFQRGYLHVETDSAKLGPKLSRANFKNANLNGVDFGKDAVDVEGTCFEKASFNDADINGFNLTTARGLTRQQVEASKGKPKVPPDFQELSCVCFMDCERR